MGTPPIDTSSSKDREAAVETLIDMDPNGAACRISRAKVCIMNDNDDLIV